MLLLNLNQKVKIFINFIVEEEKSTGGFFGSFTSFISSAKDTVIDKSKVLSKQVVETTGNMKDKFDKLEVGDKIIAGGTTAFISAKGFGEKALEKGKEVGSDIYVINFLIYFKVLTEVD